MRKVCFLIPASPTRAFWSQIALFQAALTSLNWSHWEPSVLACLGGELDADAWTEWRPELPDLTTIFVPPAESARTEHYYAQIDGLFRWAPLDADVFARMDADTLPVGDLEDLLDHVVESRSIAGVMAHQTFPVEDGQTSREAWLRAADGLIDVPLDFRYSYSLVEASGSEENRLSPFYLNDGAVFFPKALFREYAERYLDLRPRLMERLRYPYFAGQVALALAVAAMGAPTCALPLRYNFPNDAVAEQRFPEELENVQIFHYLRTDQFDRQFAFTTSGLYQEFLQAPLTGSNKVFQSHVRRILGAEFPFLRAHEHAAEERPMTDVQNPKPAHPRDISAEDLAFALAAQSNPALLSELVELSRGAFGFFPSLYPHTITYPWAVRRLQVLAAGSRLLDIGAGVSSVPLFLAGQGLRVDCVDHSQHVRTFPLAANCNEWGFLDYGLLSPNLTSHHCDITNFNPTTSYDAVYAIGSFAHMTRVIREDTLRRVHTWLRPGGLLLLTIDLIPASDFIWNRTEGREVEPPIRHGTIQGLTDHLVRLGFNLGELKVTRSVYKSRTDLLYITAHRAA